MSVMITAEGPNVVALAREKARTYLDRIIADMATQEIGVVTEEIRFRTYKTEDRIDVLWRATLPVGRVSEARDYLVRLAESEAGE